MSVGCPSSAAMPRKYPPFPTMSNLVRLSWCQLSVAIVLLCLAPATLAGQPDTKRSVPKNQATPSGMVYVPIQVPATGLVKDILSDRDIPTGDTGFARDYLVKFTAGEQVAIDLSSEAFDTVVILMTLNGKTVGKNDDGPEGNSNSLLFARIKEAGTYIIRVQGFGEISSGEFNLKVTRLKPE
jgi:hypothetical protein